MTIEQASIAVIIPFAVTIAVIAGLKSSRWTRGLADIPNARSLHDAPVARVGGLGILAGALPVAAWQAPHPLATLLACALALAVVSLADDLRSLPVYLRLASHLLAAGVATIAVMRYPTQLEGAGWLEFTLGVLALAWMTDLFNFMDGTDGLAGGMGAIGFATLAWASYAGDALPLAVACTALASACAAFLAFNFPPARVFMGDAGSIPLGFLAGALGLQGIVSGTWPVAFPLLVFSPFIVDATVTLLRRLASGQRIWVAHREHAYQRLVLAGWTRRRLAGWAYLLMAACAASALALRGLEPMLQCGIIFGWVALYALLLVAIERSARLSPR